MTNHSARNSALAIAILGMVIAGLAEAAPKKRTRNQNRIGAYGVGYLGQTSYQGDPSENEQQIEDILTGNDIPFQNMVAGTEQDDISYQFGFGYRFHRFFAAEVGLVQYGEMESTATAEIDLGDGDGFVPADLSLGFSTGGIMFSALGMLPFNDKFEMYGRAGFIFANGKREFATQVEGQPTLIGDADADSHEPVFGLGFGWHINVRYTIRAEYQVISELEDSGTEGLDNISLGLIVRF